jgi:hypothetical protein
VNRSCHSANGDWIRMNGRRQGPDRQEDEGVDSEAFHKKHIHGRDTRRRLEENGFRMRCLPNVLSLV